MASSKKYPDWFTSEVRKAVKIALAQGEHKDWFKETALKGAASDDFGFLTSEKLESAKELAETGATDLDAVSLDDFAAQIKAYLKNTAKTLNIKAATAPVAPAPAAPAPAAPAPVAPAPATAPVAEAPVAGAAPEAAKKSIFERKVDFNTLLAAVVVAAFTGYILGRL